MMNIAELSIRKKTISWVFVVLLIVGGANAFEHLGRLEDPEFTIKDAQVITFYPGATPVEVEEEVTEVLETAIQELAQLDKIESESKSGKSVITVTIKDRFDKVTLPQVWDELRRKIGDAQGKLPPGVKPSIVYDDFGDVYGILLALSGKGYTYRDLKDQADFLKRELLQIDNVAKIIIWGEQQEQIFVEISRAKMSQLGISLDAIYATLAQQNFVVPSGAVQVGPEYIRIRPTGEIDSVEEISDLLVRGGREGKSYIYLKDIANVSRGFITPPTPSLRFDGQSALALGISIVPGGNVVNLGRDVKQKLAQLNYQMPVGMKIDTIYFQADGVEKSVNSFLINLAEAIAIVIVILMVFMGLRSGLLIGVVLLLTVMGTFIFMDLYGIALERISLGALIIALGMLVDNAIVVTEGILIRIEQGEDSIQAANKVVAQTIWPLFGATVIAILAFSAIGLSQDSTGEYTRSLFQVILISLGLSWLIAITLTPVFCVQFLKSAPKLTGNETRDPYQGFIFKFYKGMLNFCLRMRLIAIAVPLGLLALALYGFGFLEDSFFPDSTSSQFMIHFWLPEGTDIRKTSENLKQIEAYILKTDGVKSVSTFIGAGAPRYMLVYSPEKAYDSYGLLLVEATDFKLVNKLVPQFGKYITSHFVNANPKIEKIRLGPGGGYSIEARFSGPNPNVLRKLAEQAKDIMRSEPNAVTIRDNWRQRVKIIRPEFAETQARRAGITRKEISTALETAFTGLQVGLYRERDELLPIISRPPLAERTNVDNLNDLLVWSPLAQTTVPLRQLVTGFKTSWEDAIIHRRDKKRTLTAQCEPKVGNASVLLAKLKPQIEAIPLPLGYTLEWGGEYEDSRDAQAGISKNLPSTFLLMLLIIIILFNSIRKPLIILLTVPLAIIGVTAGLLITNESFGFMAMLGFLSLSGMLIKNAIVLIDEIDLQLVTLPDRYEALVTACVSRLRPVTMAAITTILGMIPLLGDVFFIAMAVTIMSGLAFATFLTLLFVPVLYSLFFNIKRQKE